MSFSSAKIRSENFLTIEGNPVFIKTSFSQYFDTHQVIFFQWPANLDIKINFALTASPIENTTYCYFPF